MRGFIHMLINEDAETFTPMKEDFDRIIDAYTNAAIFDEIHEILGN